MPSFGVALAIAEELTAEMKSVTQHLGRKPLLQRPRSLKMKISQRFGNVSLEEVVTDNKRIDL
eukprot:CAMPEP_0201105794 /NCGR_PEP_ID=MMETSP0812-20130820/47997_1 /ASSEMBLY_ACC=CAM_ASM_000668 /TAXON_ID=98059 /ORGANISM="Dinobryon sp., Strain UTEXLB2267" /LENGTH=62 /DNA_ID=CAMNT_0047365833 /DNA_START=1 /DNA_END=189 /DNA_ORIENTATION=-